MTTERFWIIRRTRGRPSIVGLPPGVEPEVNEYHSGPYTCRHDAMAVALDIEHRRLVRTRRLHWALVAIAVIGALVLPAIFGDALI